MLCFILQTFFYLETRSLAEPAGALALAGLKQYLIDRKLVGAGKKFVVVVSGANINFGRLRFVAERAELGEGREALFTAEIPEQRGRYVIIVWYSFSPLDRPCPVSSLCIV